jgi:hypothetical protein
VKTFRVKEKTSAIYTAILKDGSGNPIALSDITTLTLTYFNEDDSIINTRNAQNVLNTNDVTVHITSGLLTWTLGVVDTTIATQTKDTELHVARFDFTYGTPTKTGRHEAGFRCVNLRKLT